MKNRSVDQETNTGILPQDAPQSKHFSQLNAPALCDAEQKNSEKTVVLHGGDFSQFEISRSLIPARVCTLTSKDLSPILARFVVCIAMHFARQLCAHQQ